MSSEATIFIINKIDQEQLSHRNTKPLTMPHGGALLNSPEGNEPDCSKQRAVTASSLMKQVNFGQTSVTLIIENFVKGTSISKK